MRGVILALIIFSFLDRLDGAPVVPCFFVFGDSLNDNGNNNNIHTIAKANYPPHGIDFPDGSTGRFCNGRTASDFIVESLGFDKFLLPYANSSGKDILRGLNYAVAGSGILDETATLFGPIETFSDQVKNHGETVSRTKKILGGNESTALAHLSKCLYYIQLGSNDYLGNYFNPRHDSSRRRYNHELFADLLIRTYTERIKTLYELGARKLILVGVGPIGCIPYVLSRTRQTGSRCEENFHRAVRVFNDKLKSLVDDLNRYYTDSKFIYVDSFCSAQELFDSPASYGFTITNKGCCGIGRNNGKINCIPNQAPVGESISH